MRRFLVCGFAFVLLVSGVVSAQNPPPPGGDGGRPGQGRPLPPNGNPPVPGEQPPPPPGGNGGGPGRGPGGRGGFDFPSDYAADFALYAVVDRPDNVSRVLYINRESLAALQSGQPLPEGTTLVIEAYDSTMGAEGRLVREGQLPFIHVSQKLGGRWRFASFTAAGTRADPNLPDENPRTCAGCHNDTRDFVFTRPLIEAFAQTQTVQYFFCGQAGREPCR